MHSARPATNWTRVSQVISQLAPHLDLSISQPVLMPAIAILRLNFHPVRGLAWTQELISFAFPAAAASLSSSPHSCLPSGTLRRVLFTMSYLTVPLPFREARYMAEHIREVTLRRHQVPPPELLQAHTDLMVRICYLHPDVSSCPLWFCMANCCVG